jgi:glycerate kinase
VVAAPDKFRGSATAAEIAAAVGRAAWDTGWDCDEAPVADGGEGILEALGGRVRRTIVTGPLREKVDAEWRMQDRTAVIEMALAAGIDLAGGPEGNDPMAATTTGVGELMAEAIRQGARRVIVGLGGSATTDGGEGALVVLERVGRARGIEVVGACDVETTFVDAARVFAPQKGATPAQVELLTRRLVRLAQVYEERYGVDVSDVPGSGAAGGLGGGLVAIGATLVSGFDLVAETIELDERIEGADLVVTGEGFVDDQSFAGKAVGGVIDLASAAGVPVLVVAGDVQAGLTVPPNVQVVSLVERFGIDRAFSHPANCVEDTVRAQLSR